MHQYHVHESRLDLMLCHFLQSTPNTVMTVGSVRAFVGLCKRSISLESLKLRPVSLFVFRAFNLPKAFDFLQKEPDEPQHGKVIIAKLTKIE